MKNLLDFDNVNFEELLKTIEDTDLPAVHTICAYFQKKNGGVGLGVLTHFGAIKIINFLISSELVEYIDKDYFAINGKKILVNYPELDLR